MVYLIQSNIYKTYKEHTFLVLYNVLDESAS